MPFSRLPRLLGEVQENRDQFVQNWGKDHGEHGEFGTEWDVLMTGNLFLSRPLTLAHARLEPLGEHM